MSDPATEQQERKWKLMPRVSVPDGHGEIWREQPWHPNHDFVTVAYLNALETELKTLRAKAELADEIRPLVELLAARIGKIPFAGAGETWEVFEAWARIARDGNIDGPCWIARFDSLTQPAGEGG